MSEYLTKTYRQYIKDWYSDFSFYQKELSVPHSKCVHNYHKKSLQQAKKWYRFYLNKYLDCLPVSDIDKKVNYNALMKGE